MVSASSGWTRLGWLGIAAFPSSGEGNGAISLRKHRSLAGEIPLSIADQKTEAVATRAWAVDRMIYVELTDQRIVGFPANRFRRLREASERELADVRLEVAGTALRWESLDEDITIEGVVAGRFQLPPVV